VEELNRHLLATLPEGMFVSLFLALLDLRTGLTHYVNCGHPPAVLFPAGGADWARLVRGGPVLGILPEARYQAGQVVLEPGSLLALFSDGIADGTNEAGERFQENRVIEVLRRHPSAPAAAVLDRMFELVEQFAGRSRPTDDMSLLLIRRFARRYRSR
jgi:sigma-B regulation protein RsbU (phosphoserine phosphatase)